MHCPTQNLLWDHVRLLAFCVLISVTWQCFYKAVVFQKQKRHEKASRGKKKKREAKMTWELRKLHLHDKRDTEHIHHPMTSRVCIIMWHLKIYGLKCEAGKHWSQFFRRFCLQVRVRNMKRCGWLSGIKSGSVSILGCGAADVRRCNNDILCVLLCWPILDLRERESDGAREGEKSFHNVPSHCCSETVW